MKTTTNKAMGQLIAAMMRREARLVEALKPFAACGERTSQYSDQERPIISFSFVADDGHNRTVVITGADFTKAAEALDDETVQEATT